MPRMVRTTAISARPKAKPNLDHGSLDGELHQPPLRLRRNMTAAALRLIERRPFIWLRHPRGEQLHIYRIARDETGR